MLVTRETKFGQMSRHEFALRNPSFTGDRTPPADGVALGVKALAEANAGRWIARCPDPDCNGAEFVSFLDPVFFCHECRNAGVAHLLIAIETPDESTRVQVEAYLLARPVAVTRNWQPHEPLKALRDENRAHGIRLSP